ncbi:MAG: helix-turn-helix domain-containing protein [Pseudomonadota bacterium]
MPLIKGHWENEENFLAQVSSLCGKSVAERLVAEYGGCRAYFPTAARLTPHHKISRVVGFEEAQKICSELIAASHPADIEISLGKETFYQRVRKTVLEMTLEKKSASEIARHLGISRRAVFHNRRLLREEGALK